MSRLYEGWLINRGTSYIRVSACAARREVNIVSWRGGLLATMNRSFFWDQLLDVYGDVYESVDSAACLYLW